MLCDRTAPPSWDKNRSSPCGMRTPVRLISKAEGLVEELANDEADGCLERIGKSLVDVADGLGFKVLLCDAMPDPTTFFHGGVRWLTFVPKYGNRAAYDAFYLVPDFAAHWNIRSPSSQFKAALAENLRGPHFVGPASALYSLLDTLELIVSESFSDLPPWRSASVWKTALTCVNPRFVNVKELNCSSMPQVP